MPDTRRQVGGDVWAKAEAVSREAKRVYGAAISRTWVRGTVLEVIIQRNEGSKRATTMVKASYMIGNMEKVACIPLQSLKDKDPSAAAPTEPTATNNETAESDGSTNMPALEHDLPTADIESFEDSDDDLEVPQAGPRCVSSNNGRTGMKVLLMLI